MGYLDGRVVLVSGGTGSIGAECAIEVARQGAEAVVITGRNAARGSRTVAKIKEAGSPASFIPVELTDTTSARLSVRKTVESFGRVDCLINAAGLTSRGTLLDTDANTFDELISVNLKAPFFLMQEAVQDMTRRKSSGTIVNIISISAHGGQPYLMSLRESAVWQTPGVVAAGR